MYIIYYIIKKNKKTISKNIYIYIYIKNHKLCRIALVISALEADPKIPSGAWPAHSTALRSSTSNPGKHHSRPAVSYLPVKRSSYSKNMHYVNYVSSPFVDIPIRIYRCPSLLSYLILFVVFLWFFNLAADIYDEDLEISWTSTVHSPQPSNLFIYVHIISH